MIAIDVDPVAFTIGPFEVRWYGIMIALGVLAVVLWVLWEVKRGAKIGGQRYYCLWNHHWKIRLHRGWCRC